MQLSNKVNINIFNKKYEMNELRIIFFTTLYSTSISQRWGTINLMRTASPGLGTTF